VGSRLLSKRYEAEPLSSATIRNVLSDLEDEAFLVQPHTSAGRVPTERAYRYYVDRWVRPLQPDPELGARLASTLEERDLDPEGWLRHASRVLAEVMQGVCVALPRRLSGSRLMKLEFVPLEPGRIVAIWVGSGGDVEHQLVENAWGFTPEALTEMGNFATTQFRGLTLSDMRQRLLLSLQGQAQEGRLLRERLADLTQRLQAGESAAPPVVVAGLGALGAQPEFEDLQAFRGLVRAFEEQERLARLLNAFAEASATRIQLLLGSENPYLDAWPLATAVRTVPLGPGESVTFAVVGPMRMDYGRVLGGLQWWSEALVRRSGEEPNGV
jgi:heat-inducible transcriptional repressor